MRLPEGPWYRASRDAWFVEIDGRQGPLGKHPKGAPIPKKSEDTGRWNAPKAIRDAYNRLMVLGPGGLPKKADITAAHVCDLFLTFSKSHHDERTFRGTPPSSTPSATARGSARCPRPRSNPSTSRTGSNSTRSGREAAGTPSSA
jgi:hypothetical protein